MGLQNVFNAKGEAAEQLVASLCEDAFFEDFCFKNPYYAPGKELCDVLIVLGEVAIIWQIKSVEIDSGKFNESDVRKAVRQCRGARRRLLNCGVTSFVNTVNKNKIIDTSKIQEVFLIAAFEGGTPEFTQFYDQEDNGNVHIFLESFTRFATKHLNTVSDFVEYLRCKEKFLAKYKRVVCTSGEQDLLAFYLKSARTFANMEDSNDADMMVIDLDGAAEELENQAEYIEKLDADKWSRVWDELIAMKRTALMTDASEATENDRDKFLQKMMSHSRFERRELGRQFFEAAVEASKLPYEENRIFRRLVPQDSRGVTYVFVFIGEPNAGKEKRQAMLYTTALAARQFMPQNDMLIAIATEFHMAKNSTRSLEWVMLDMTTEEFEREYGDEASLYRERLNIWKSPTIRKGHAWEYPSDGRRNQNKKA